jgi:hypothetical protein
LSDSQGIEEMSEFGAELSYALLLIVINYAVIYRFHRQGSLSKITLTKKLYLFAFEFVILIIDN